MATERKEVLERPEIHDEQSDAIRQATERAERAEAELAKLKQNASRNPEESSTAQRPSTDNTERALKNPLSPSTAHAMAGSDAVNQRNVSRCRNHE